MKQSLMQMITCHWSGRHIQRYLDADPAAPLTAEEVARIEGHLAICDKCTQLAAEHRALHGALSRLIGEAGTDHESVARLHKFLIDITGDDPR